MIQCNVCGEYFDPDDIYIWSDLEWYTYYDAVACRTCAVGTITYCDKYNLNLWCTRYDHMRHDLINHSHTDERICPVCNGIMMWDLFDSDEGLDDDEMVYVCTNCGFWIYDEFVMSERYAEINA